MLSRCRWRYDNASVISKAESRLAAARAQHKKKGQQAGQEPSLTPEQVEFKRKLDAIAAFQAALLHGSAISDAGQDAKAAAGCSKKTENSVCDLVDLCDEDSRPGDMAVDQPAGAASTDAAAASTEAPGSLTMEQLALASHACGAHARALRHYETWLRHKKGQLNNAARACAGVTFSDAEVCMHMNTNCQLDTMRHV
jgi:hypothetical protein